MRARVVLVVAMMIGLLVAAPVAAAPHKAVTEVTISSLVASSDGNTVFVVSDGALLRSTNASAPTPTWVNLGKFFTLRGDSEDAITVGLSAAFASDHTIFVIGSSGDIFRSTNANAAAGAVTFANVGSPLQFPSGTILAISPNYAVDHIVFVGSFSGLFRSTNANAAALTWTEVSNGLPSEFVTGLVLSPSFATDHVRFFGINYKGTNLYRSDNAQAATPTFLRLDAGPGSVQGGLPISPNYAADHTLFDSFFFRVTAADTNTPTLTFLLPAIGIILSPTFATDHLCIGVNLFQGTNCDGAAAFNPPAPSPLDLLQILNLIWPTGTVAFIGTQGGGLWRSANITDPVPTYQQILSLSNAPALPPPPTSTITSIDPSRAQVADYGFGIIVTGTNFIQGVSVGQFGGIARTTYVNSSTELFVILNASDTIRPGTGIISVMNTGGGTSNAMTLTLILKEPALGRASDAPPTGSLPIVQGHAPDSPPTGPPAPLTGR